MRVKICLSLTILLGVFLISGLNVPLLNPASAFASSQIIVADVCTKSFSVIYNLSEPSQGNLNLKVYNSTGDQITEGITIENEIAPAQTTSSNPSSNRIVKFTVKGLGENIRYFYQLTVNNTAFLPPDNPAYYGQDYTVTTEKLNDPNYLSEKNIITNDTLFFPVYKAGGTTVLGASLVYINIFDSLGNQINDYPLSGWGGSCSLPDGKYANINLNNLYDKKLHTPLELNGGESAAITYLNEALTIVNREVKFTAYIPLESTVDTTVGPKVIPMQRVAYFYHPDADLDGYGKADSALFFRPTAPSGYSKEGNDCDDSNAQVYPGAVEISDGKDNNCNGVIDEGLCNGDLNGDDSVTPSDALIAFKCYLGSGPCTSCTDVTKDGDVTPSDALCLFKKYLGATSCLD